MPRYAVFHPRWYEDETLLRERMREFSDCLKPLYRRGRAELHEVVECEATGGS